MTFMFNRRIRLVLNSVAIVTLLFAQVASATQACAAARDTPQMAFSVTHCAEMPSQNVCLQQYVSGFQNSGPTQVPVADFPNIVVVVLAALPTERQFTPRDYWNCPQSSTDPPISIRFCSFQI
jgi:hypothetical protein